MKAVVILVALVAVVLAASVTDHCNVFHDCADCVADVLCGWCSTKVVYQNGAPGHHCAGFNSHGHNPFVCNGIYSTDTCIRGYVCDPVNMTCVLGKAGGGVPLSTCEANCTTVGKTYICDNTTHTCKQAPPGKGTSFQNCMTECSATHAPSSHAPSSHSPSSHSPSSHSPSSHHPSTPAPTVSNTYVCNTTTYECDKAQPGHGSSKSVCEAGCHKPHPHNITPPVLMGTWRGIEISKGFPDQEFDMKLEQDSVSFYVNSKMTIECSVQSYGSDQVWFVDCKAGSPFAEMKCLYKTTGALPETYQLLLGCNNDGAAPTSSEDAMTAGGHVSASFWSKCVPNEKDCTFYFGPHVHGPRGFGAQSVASETGVMDRCQAYGANCTFCLDHKLCGWCSQNVVYKNGEVGNQCAGFTPGKKSDFTCSGTYSTENCPIGYNCDPVNQTCVLAPPGEGVPKALCDTQCKPKPGPVPFMIGYWRGLQINNGYAFGEFEANITKDAITLSFDGTEYAKGKMFQVDGKIDVVLNTGKGGAMQTFSGIYATTQNELVMTMDLAFGLPDQPAPTNFQVAMGSAEYVMSKCIAATGCTW